MVFASVLPPYHSTNNKSLVTKPTVPIARQNTNPPQVVKTTTAPGRPYVQIGNIQVCVVKGQITNEQVDVIVNGVPPDLDLMKPRASAVLVNAAGPSIQTECNNKYPKGINIGDVAETRAGNLKCQNIFHVTLPKSKADGSENETLVNTVKICLKRANKSHHTSIAFPDIGSSVGFPASILADLMFQGVLKYTKEVKNSCITSVVFSIYRENVFQKFKNKAREAAAVSRVSHSQVGNISIHLKVGKLVDQQVDVIVCSGPKDLQLANGGIAGALLAVAGPSLQQECHKNYPNGIDFGDVAIAQGHSLKCKYVYFGSLPDWGTSNPDPKQTLEDFITNCLEEANKHELTKSMAFPALGTGNLNYPYEDVAQVMSKCIKSFDQAHPNTDLRHINIVVYNLSGNWSSVEKAFQTKFSMNSAGAPAPSSGPTIQGTPGSLQYYQSLYKQIPVSPSYWTKYHSRKTLTDWNSNISPTTFDLVQVDAATFKAVEMLTVQSWKSQYVGKGRDAAGLDVLNYKNIKVTKVERLENPTLFEVYVKHRAHLLKKAGRIGTFKSLDTIPYGKSKASIATTDLANAILQKEIYPGINEHYFFHGTLENYLNNIISQGLDPRLTQNAFFGKGVYAAESSTKADQYTDAPNQRNLKEKKMFLIRMCLGEVYIRTDTINQRNYTKPPCQVCQDDRCLDKNHLKFFDSIVVDGGWNFREFIVFDKKATYPEYLITYTRV